MMRLLTTLLFCLTSCTSVLAQNSTYWTRKGINAWDDDILEEVEFDYFTKGYNAGEAGSAAFLAMCYMTEHGTVRNIEKATTILDTWKCKSECTAWAAICCFYDGKRIRRPSYNDYVPIKILGCDVYYPYGEDYWVKTDMSKAVAAAAYLERNGCLTEDLIGTGRYDLARGCLGYGYEFGIGGLKRDLVKSSEQYLWCRSYITDRVWGVGVKMLDEARSTSAKLDAIKTFLSVQSISNTHHLRAEIFRHIFDNGHEYYLREELFEYCNAVSSFYESEIKRIMGDDWQTPGVIRARYPSLLPADEAVVEDFIDGTLDMAEYFQDAGRLEWMINEFQKRADIQERAKTLWTKIQLYKEFDCHEQYPGIKNKPWKEYLKFRESEFYSDKGDNYEDNVIRAKKVREDKMSELRFNIDYSASFFDLQQVSPGADEYFVYAEKTIGAEFLAELSEYREKLKKLNDFYCEPGDTSITYPEEISLAMEYVENIDGRKHVLPAVLTRFLDKFDPDRFTRDGKINRETRDRLNYNSFDALLSCMYKAAFNLYPDALIWEKDLAAFNAAFALKSTSSKNEISAVRKLPMSKNMAVLVKYMTAKKNIRTKEDCIAGGLEKEYRAKLLEAIGERE